VTAEKFLDTSYAIALVSGPDRHHDRAIAWADRIEAHGTRLVTTRAVLLEIGNALGKLRFRATAVQLLASLESDPNVIIIPLTDALYAAAFDMYRQRPDKEWGLIDCISFVVMADRKLTEVLTADEHFEQAGFVALLHRDP
jgi:predicted nucleic acid-binding protein